MSEKPLWAPWRIDYILGQKPDGCVFCGMVSDEDDRKNNILYRGELNYIVLNLYPYNTGHLMIVPYRHTSDYSDLNSEELAESAELTQKGLNALSGAFDPHGFNMGVNQGNVAGAGIEEHLHIHIVPRWSGDFNFMPVVGKTKVMPLSLPEVYDEILKHL
jgi:ATP adenylyltransferase